MPILWEIKTPRIIKKQPVSEACGPTPAGYLDTGIQMTELLRSRGWFAAECEALAGDIIIVVVSPEITGYPTGYPVYTESEFITLANAGDSMSLIHAAKKEGARIEGVIE